MENQTMGMNEQTTGTTTEAGATAPEKAQDAKASTSECTETASKSDSRGRTLSPELREKYLKNPYVKAINQVGDITYKSDFYKDMYGYIHYGQMTYVEAYEKLGFRVDELGENRALSAGKRAVKTQEAGEIRPGKYNGTIPLADMDLEGKSDAEIIAMLKAHIFFLEAYQEAQKKNVLYTPTSKIIIKADKVIVDFNLMAATLCDHENRKPEDERLPLEEILKMLNINKINYDAWYRQKTSQMEEGQTLSESEKAWEDDKELMIKIIQKVSYVPGVRTFRSMFWNYYGRNVSLKRVRKLMKALNLVAYKRKRDAYKHQATHNHPFSVPCGNIVNRDFYLAPRRVVCTDITYVYFGKNRETHYVCCFKDAYTTEILGWASSATMDTELVVKAYEMMMSKHGDELRKAKVLIHSDQGSQYCSLEYRNKLDDCFVQSMSRRGNSLDNYPIESFFGLFKGMALDTIALCKKRSQVDTMVDHIIDTYNNRPQDQLACLTPTQYYDYATTGIYPLSSYFGVDASELRRLYELREDREVFAAKEAKRRKERFAGKEAMERRNKEADEKIKAAQAAPMGTIDPLERIKTDRKCTQKHYQDNHKKLEEKAELEYKYEVLQNLIDMAEEFLKDVSPDVYELLCYPENWKYFTELSYIYEMDEMF